MPRSLLSWIGRLGFVVGVAGAGYAVGHLRTSAVAASTPPATAGAPADTTRAWASLMARAAAAMPATPAGAPEGDPLAKVDVPLAPAPTAAQEAAWLVARARRYDEVLAAEPRDEAWALPLERRALELAPPGDGPVRLVGAECRSSTCRVELTFDDPAARNDRLRELTASFPEVPHAAYAYPNAPGSYARVVLHLTRDGHALPRYEYALYAEDLNLNR